MKKLVSIILAVMLVSALAVTSFAAPTVEYVFNDADTTYVYGSLAEDDVITDMGMKITNKNNIREYAEFSAIDSDEIFKVNNSGKFGFRIMANGMLNDSFIVKPYCETADGTVEGLSYVINSVNETKEEVAEGSSVATDDVLILNRTSGWGSAFGQGENGTKINMIAGKSSTGYKCMFVKFDIGNATKASDIYMTFASTKGFNGYSFIEANPFEVKVYGVEDAIDTWSDAELTTTKSYCFADIMGCAKTQDEMVPAMNKIFAAEPVSVVTENNMKIVSVSNTKCAIMTIDVTEFVKQQAAKGKTTVTFAIDAQTIEGGLGFNTSESTLDDSVKPCLAWK